METITLENKTCFVGYRVLTRDFKSLGLRRNPNILQYPVGEWYFLPENKVIEGKDDFGGIWVARTFGNARRLCEYMKEKHDTGTRLFKAAIDRILFENSYRIKTNGIYLIKELMKFTKKSKGLSVEECVNEAERLISEQGICLLAFDVKGSSKFEDRNKLQKDLYVMMNDLNKKFSEYFPKNTLATMTREEKGFWGPLGDGSWAGINSSKIIPEIIEYQKQKYSNIPLYWGIGKDGWDEELRHIIF